MAKGDKIPNEFFRLSRVSHVKRRKESSRLEVIERTVARYRFGYSDSSYQLGGCYPHQGVLPVLTCTRSIWMRYPKPFQRFEFVEFRGRFTTSWVP